jgi:replication factor A1
MTSHGTDDRTPPPPTATPSEREVRLRDLGQGGEDIQLTFRLLTSERREVARRSDGKKFPVLSGLASDGTAAVRFTWWDPPAAEIEKGSVLRVSRPQVREWKGRPEISLGRRSRVEVASELDLRALGPEEYYSRSIAELKAGDEGFRLAAKVLSVARRTAVIGGRAVHLQCGWLADGSGRIAFSSWTERDLEMDTAIEVRGAHVRSFQGTPELVLDQRSLVARLPDGELDSVRGLEEAMVTAIAELEVRRGGAGSLVEGVVTELRTPSGLVACCPRCHKALAQGRCREDGAVRGEMELRARLVIDDGTGSATAQLDGDAVEALTGLSKARALEIARERIDPGSVADELRAKLLLRRVRLFGRALVGDGGVTLFVDRPLWSPGVSAGPATPDPLSIGGSMLEGRP